MTKINEIIYTDYMDGIETANKKLDEKFNELMQTYEELQNKN